MTPIDAIYDRRSVHDFARAQVARSTIEELLDAAVQAPSSLNRQPWCFVVLEGVERLKDYSSRAKRHYLTGELPPLGLHNRYDTLTDDAYNIFYNAKTVIVIFAVPGGLNVSEDCCLAAQNLMLAAHSLGLATCPVGIARPWMNLPEVKEELGIPAHHLAVFPLALGYAATQPKPQTRKSPEIVAWLSDLEPGLSARPNAKPTWSV